MYCRPNNAGLASEPVAVGKRIARLLNALETEVNGYVCEGAILDDVRGLRIRLIESLEAEGWRIKAKDGAIGWNVRPPKGAK